MSTNCSPAIANDEKKVTSPYTVSTTWVPDKSATISLSSDSYAFCVTVSGYDGSGKFETEFSISDFTTGDAQDCKSMKPADVIPCLEKLFGFPDMRCLDLLKALSERCISLFEGPVKEWYQEWSVLKSEIDVSYASYETHLAQGSSELANHHLEIARAKCTYGNQLQEASKKENERIEFAISEAFAKFLESVNPHSENYQKPFYQLIDYTKQV